MANVGSQIFNSDYNAIRNKVINILGSGAGQSGYGQLIQSSLVAQGNQVTSAQWDSLRYDVINAAVHQNGSPPSVTSVTSGETIKFGTTNPNNQYDALADLIVTNKFLVADGQYVIDSGTTVTYNTDWNTAVTDTVTVTFSTAQEARYFFNSGGKIRFRSSRTGGSATAQNSSWSNLLTGVGTVNFGANTQGCNFYNLTNSYQTVYTLGANSPYASNNFLIRAYSNIADNSAGGATVITFNIIWSDNYAYSGAGIPATVDNVNGTLTLVVEELRASGSLLPIGAGSFYITRPAYSATAITPTATPAYNIYTSQTAVNEGTSVTVVLTTSAVANGTTLYWDTVGTITALDFVGGADTGSTTITNNFSTFNVLISSDALTEGAESFQIRVKTGSLAGPIVATSSTIVISDTSQTSSYSVTPASASVTEGGMVTFNISTTGVPNGTVLYWTTTSLSGTVLAGDFSDNTLSGQVTIAANTGIIQRIISSDITTEGTETFNIQLRTGSISGSIVATSPTVTISDTSVTPPAPPTYGITPNLSTLSEGSTVTFGIVTTNVANGTQLYWTLQSTLGTINAGDFVGGAINGSVTITSNSASLSLTLSLDSLTEGSEAFYVQLRVGSLGGTVVASSSTVTILDTSTTPTPIPTPVNPSYQFAPVTSNISEGQAVTFVVQTTNVGDGTTLYWSTTVTAGNLTSSDFTDNSLSGSTIVNSGVATITRTLSSDSAVEGSESFLLGIRTTPTGAVQAQSQVVSVTDTTIAGPSYSVVPSRSSASEGETVVFVINTTNIPNGRTLNYQFRARTGAFGSADITDGTISATLTIQSNNASISKTLSSDQLTEGTESFYLRITDTVSGTVTDSSDVTVLDTSQAPPPPSSTYTVSANVTSIDESQSVAFTIETTNVSVGSKLYYTLETISGTLVDGDFTTARTGEMTVQLGDPIPTDGYGSFTFMNDGALDYAGTSGSLAQELDGDFTLEFFAKQYGRLNTYNTFLEWGNWSNPTILVRADDGNGPDVFVGGGSGVGYRIENSISDYIPLNQWTHVAITRRSGTVRAFVNGILRGALFGFIGVINSQKWGMLMGSSRHNQATQRYYGRLSNVRVIKGDCLYITNFTPPTNPLTNSLGGVVFLGAHKDNINLASKLGQGATFSTDSPFTPPLGNNKATLVLTTRNDQLTEGQEQWRLQVRTNSIVGPVVATSQTVTVRDTSLSVTYQLTTDTTDVTESDTTALRYTVTTTGVPNGTVLFYNISSTGSLNSADFVTSAGSVSINNNTGVFNIYVKADLSTEGDEVFAVNLKTGNALGPTVATSQIRTIKDTSVKPLEPIMIAVIDESSTSTSTLTSAWNSFRSNYPTRLFYLLQPGTDPTKVKAPSNFTSDARADGPIAVARDGGTVSKRSDWFAACNLTGVPAGTKIALSIDDSGSMNATTVKASKDLFVQKCAAAGLPIVTVSMAGENWIANFNKAF
jgi:hypothetical protein